MIETVFKSQEEVNYSEGLSVEKDKPRYFFSNKTQFFKDFLANYDSIAPKDQLKLNSYRAESLFCFLCETHHSLSYPHNTSSYYYSDLQLISDILSQDNLCSFLSSLSNWLKRKDSPRAGFKLPAPRRAQVP